MLSVFGLALFASASLMNSNVSSEPPVMLPVNPLLLSAGKYISASEFSPNIIKNCTLDGISSQDNNSVFTLGTTATLKFCIRKKAVQTFYRLSVVVTDEFGNQLANKAFAFKSDDKGDIFFETSLTPTSPGFYSIKLSTSDGESLQPQGTRPAGFLPLAVVEDPSSRSGRANVLSHFGLQGGYNRKQGDVARLMGVHYFIPGGADWSTIEAKSTHQPKSATDYEDLLDGPLKGATLNSGLEANDHGWKFFPIWSVTRASDPPNFYNAQESGSICKTFGPLTSNGSVQLPLFSTALAGEVAKNFGNESPHFYQVTWEPEKPWCFAGTAKDLVTYYKLTYQAIHGADASAVVAGPTLFPEDIQPLKALWAEGLGDYVDAVSVHPYVAWPPERGEFLSNIRTQMKLASENSRHKIQFIGTEHGLQSSEIGELNQALGDVRQTLILLGEGFTLDFSFYLADFWGTGHEASPTTYGFFWNLNPQVPFGTDRIAPKPIVPAYAAMTRIIDGSKSFGPIDGLGNTDAGYQFRNGNRTIDVVWNFGPQSTTVELAVTAKPITICSWMGRCQRGKSVNSKIAVKAGPAPTYVIW